VLSHIQQCRTPVLGGLQWQCGDCDYQRPFYHSCRNRHCPQCQKKASQQWCERQRQAVLPVPYFHIVFTLPHELNGWVELHPEIIYALFFKAVWSTLSTFGADPKRLGGQMDMSAILHTWGQNLSRHVHLHCLIPGGAYSGPS
jgi:Transposase zinc-binding domain/Putative transposase